jgi:hypothetical protein
MLGNRLHSALFGGAYIFTTSECLIRAMYVLVTDPTSAGILSSGQRISRMRSSTRGFRVLLCTPPCWPSFQRVVNTNYLLRRLLLFLCSRRHHHAGPVCRPKRWNHLKGIIGVRAPSSRGWILRMITKKLEN